jgi:5-methylcytosine-specific restriction endonuclease McrA
MNYHEYLNSKLWKQRRQAKLAKAKHRCEICGERDSLEVHHKTYAHLGNEDTNELIVLCRGCHWIAEQIRRNPNFKLPEPKPDPWADITPPLPEFDYSVLPVHKRKRQI